MSDLTELSNDMTQKVGTYYFTQFNTSGNTYAILDFGASPSAFFVSDGNVGSHPMCLILGTTKYATILNVDSYTVQSIGSAVWKIQTGVYARCFVISFEQPTVTFE